MNSPSSPPLNLSCLVLPIRSYAKYISRISPQTVQVKTSTPQSTMGDSVPSSLLPIYSPTYSQRTTTTTTTIALTQITPFASDGKNYSRFATSTSSRQPFGAEQTASQLSPVPHGSDGHLSTGTVVGIAVAIAVLFIIVLGVIGIFYRKRRIEKNRQAGMRVEMLQTWEMNRTAEASATHGRELGLGRE